MSTNSLAEDRVRKHTAPETNRDLDNDLAWRVRLYAHADRPALTRRIAELEREWDIERVLQTNAASLALTGTFLGAFVNRKWLALPFLVTGFLLQHAVQGWCPPVPVLRRMGVRTRAEIEKERYALKELRGDFGKEPPDAETLLRSLDK